MKRFVIGILIMLCACQRALPPQEACGFYQNEGQRVVWRQLPIHLTVDKNVPNYALQPLYAAVAEYNTRALDGREVFRIVGYGFDAETGVADGYNVIDWRSSWDASMPDEEAKTHIMFQGNELYDADILVNAFSFNFDTSSPSYSYVDLESLFIHELGHSLGLNHTKEAGSVMNPILNPYQVRRTLGDVDISHLHCGY
jgi:hypothetical protein